MTTILDRPRRTIAVFDSYADAQRAVDYLSDHDFPVERVAIVGQNLRWVEQVGGRMTTGRAALHGALQGAALGGLFGLFVGLLWTVPPAILLLVLYGIVAGAIMGAAFSALAHAASRGERDFVSASTLQAERYEVMVDDVAADRAAELLRGLDPGLAKASSR